MLKRLPHSLPPRTATRSRVETKAALEADKAVSLVVGPLVPIVALTRRYRQPVGVPQPHSGFQAVAAVAVVVAEVVLAAVAVADPYWGRRVYHRHHLQHRRRHCCHRHGCRQPHLRAASEDQLL